MSFRSFEGQPLALLGSAKLAINDLVRGPRNIFESLGLKRDKLGRDEKNIERLHETFEFEGCRRGDPANRVPVLVDKYSLENILEANTIQLSDLQRPSLRHLKVPNNATLLLLHGYHRLLAGQRYLGPTDQWWGVNLYSKENTNDALLAKLLETDHNEKPFDDGTIFYRLRRCQIEKDNAGVQKWKARFSVSKRRDYAQLQRQKKLAGLRAAFDQLMAFPGFWPSLQVGTFHRILTLRCPEELTSYLQTVESQWLEIADRELLEEIDHVSISTLEGRSPFFSLADADFVRVACEGHKIFFNLSPEQKTQVLSSILKCERILLSLHTFLEDTKWLEAASKIVIGLLPATFRGTIRQGFFKYFTYPPDPAFLRTSKEEAFSNRYRRLWLFAFRKFAYMGKLKPRKTARQHSFDTRNQAECWYLFAELAESLGFVTPITRNILRADSQHYAVAADALAYSKPSAFYHVSPEFVLETAPHMVEMLKPVQPRLTAYGPPEVTTDVFQKWSLSSRCGRPFDQAFKQIERYGHFDNIYGQAPPIPRQTITHFAVFRDTFHAFFGSLPLILHPLEYEEDDRNIDFTSPINELAAFEFPEATQPPTFDVETLAQREADIETRRREEERRRQAQQDLDRKRLQAEQEELDRRRRQQAQEEYEWQQRRLQVEKEISEEAEKERRLLQQEKEDFERHRSKQQETSGPAESGKPNQLGYKKQVPLIEPSQGEETQVAKFRYRKQLLLTDKSQEEETQVVRYTKPTGHEVNQPQNKKRPSSPQDTEKYRPRLHAPKYRLLKGEIDYPFAAMIHVQLTGTTLPAILQNYHSHIKEEIPRCVIRTCPGDADDIPDLFFFANGPTGKEAHHKQIRELMNSGAGRGLFEITPGEDSKQTKFVKRLAVPWNVPLMIVKPDIGENFVTHPRMDNYNYASFWPRFDDRNGFHFHGIHQKFTPAQARGRRKSDRMDFTQERIHTEEQAPEAQGEPSPPEPMDTRAEFAGERMSTKEQVPEAQGEPSPPEPMDTRAEFAGERMSTKEQVPEAQPQMMEVDSDAQSEL